MARALRRSRGALTGLPVVIALGVGVALASVEAPRRTEAAYPSYLGRGRVGQMVVNSSLNTDRAEELVSSTPGARSYVSDSILTATPDSGEPRSQDELGSNLVRCACPVTGGTSTRTARSSTRAACSVAAPTDGSDRRHRPARGGRPRTGGRLAPRPARFCARSRCEGVVMVVEGRTGNSRSATWRAPAGHQGTRYGTGVAGSTRVLSRGEAGS